MSARLEFQSGHGSGSGGCVFVVHPEGVRLVTCGADAQLAERDESTGAVISERRLAELGTATPALGIAAAPGGGRVATVDKDGNAKVQPGRKAYQHNGILGRNCHSLQLSPVIIGYASSAESCLVHAYRY